MKAFPLNLIYNGEKDKRKFKKWDIQLRNMISKEIHLLNEFSSATAKPNYSTEIQQIIAAGQNLSTQQSDSKFKVDDRIILFENKASEALDILKSSIGMTVKSDLLDFWNITPNVLSHSIVFPRMYQTIIQRHRGTQEDISKATRAIQSDIDKLGSAKTDSEVQQMFNSLQELICEYNSFGQQPLPIEQLQHIATTILDDHQFQIERSLINIALNPPTTLSEIILIWSDNAQKARRFNNSDTQTQKAVFGATTITPVHHNQPTSTPSSSSSSTSVYAFQSQTDQQQEIAFLRKIIAERDAEIFQLRTQLHQQDRMRQSTGGGGGQRWSPPAAPAQYQQGQQQQHYAQSQMRLPPRFPPRQSPFTQFPPRQSQFPPRQYPPLPIQPPQPPPPPPLHWSGQQSPWSGQQQSRQQFSQRKRQAPGVFGASFDFDDNEQANVSAVEEIHQQQGVDLEDFTPDHWPHPDFPSASSPNIDF